MKIGFLGSSAGWHYQDFQRVAGNRHELVPLDFSQLGGTLADQCSDIYCGSQRLSDFDCILIRAMPAGSLEQVVARMDLLAQLEKLGVAVINPAKSIEAAVDKYLSLCRLREFGISLPNSGVFQTTGPALDFMKRQGSDVVFKPIFGSEGHGLERFTNVDQARIFFDQLVEQEGAIFLQKFVQNANKDLRLFVIGETVFGMSRHNDRDWRKNVSQGGEAKPYLVSSEERELAIACSTAVGTYIAGVDVIVNDAGQYQAIEVNSSPGWRTLSKILRVDIANEILKYLET